MMRFTLAVLAYLVPTFALGFVWHLVLFESYYARLEIYRHDVIIPFGFVSMLVQAILFAWVYERLFARRAASAVSRGVAFAAFGALLSWSFTTLAVAAKNVMTSVSDYVLIETAFTLTQWVIVGAVIVVLTAWLDRRVDAAQQPPLLQA